MKRTVSLLMVTLLLVSMFTATFSIRAAETGISPLTVPDEPATMQETLSLENQEPPPTEWNKTYGGTDGDWFGSMLQTDDGRFILAGTTNSFGAGNADAWLIKTDAGGNMIWNKTYGGVQNDVVTSMARTSDGGYVFAGYTYNLESWHDVWLVKVDSLGNMQWSKMYGEALHTNEEATDVVQANDGGYVLIGTKGSLPNLWLIKTDAYGNMIWNREYGGSVGGCGYTIIQSSDGGYAIAGRTWDAGSQVAWLLKTDQAGNLQWNETYGGSQAYTAISIIQTGDGGYALSGANSFGAGSAWMIKTNSSGHAEWNMTYYEGNARSIFQTSDNGYVLGGDRFFYGPPHDDFWLGRVDLNGNLLWNETYGGAEADWAYCVIQTNDGGYAIGGQTQSFGAGYWDIWIVKLSAVADSWPMFHHDPSHTGASTSTGPTTNNTLWTYTTGGGVFSSPAVVGGLVYVGSFDNCTYCLDAATGALVWSYKTGARVTSSPAVVDGLVYVGSEDGNVYCLNATTGAFVWSYTIGGFLWTSPAVVDGLVYVGSNDGNVYCLNAATGAFIWSYTTGSAVSLSSPAVANGLVYVGSYDHNVYCLNATTGAFVWSYTTGGTVLSSPAVVGGLVYVGSFNANVYCLNATTGSLVWSYGAGGIVFSSPAVAGGLVYVGSRGMGFGMVHCLNATTGSPAWNPYITGGYVESSPAVAGGLVYVGSIGDKKAYCLNAATGTLVWSYTTGGDVASSPAVVNGVVYVGSMDGKVYAFGPSGSPPTPIYVQGIDVSHYQGDINWTAVYEAGYRFAFVKATEGEGWTGDDEARDEKFEYNMNASLAAGMLVGAYHFARPDLNPNGAIDEATWFVNVSREYIRAGYIRPVLDLEKGSALGKESLSAWVHTWLEIVETETGVEPIIYTGGDYVNPAVDILNASLTEYDLWIAHWTYNLSIPPNTGIWNKWEFWQWSNESQYAPLGHVPGVEGNALDLDVFNGDLQDLYRDFVISIPGDLNLDWTVDIFDIVIVALEFGHPPPPIVDPRADVNKDGLVDIFDIVVVALHFGETG